MIVNLIIEVCEKTYKRDKYKSFEVQYLEKRLYNVQVITLLLKRNVVIEQKCSYLGGGGSFLYTSNCVRVFKQYYNPFVKFINYI